MLRLSFSFSVDISLCAVCSFSLDIPYVLCVHFLLGWLFLWDVVVVSLVWDILLGVERYRLCG
ncbi:hypothetical protein M6B38_245135 [Iris pallida]|uniref:Uncharacterized protein n=1 Tax=Iris pallida TaxID=29817 RepID=A0AAX6DI87_IRIPA|nr:hypothetical protein M6B38_245135 [Iris pallida]